MKFPEKYKYSLYKVLAWVTTYYYYFALFYMYMPLSVVKGTLNPPCLLENETGNWTIQNVSEINNCKGWEPFIGDHGNTLLGILDFSLFFSYAVASLIIGNISDHFDYRYTLCISGVLQIIASLLFGSGYYLGIHSFAYYLFCQILLGVGSSSLSACLGVVGKWCNGKRNGSILGVWSTSLPMGRIVGKLVPGIWSDYAWGVSFYSSTFVIATATILVFIFLLPEPNYLDKGKKEIESAKNTNDHTQQETICILKALCIPGVIEYSIVFFNALSAYIALLFWIPYIFTITEIEGVNYATSTSSKFSVIFDVGSLFGSVIGGGLADLVGSHAIVVSLYLYLSILLLYCYYALFSIKLVYNLFVLFLIGLTLGGVQVILFNCISVVIGNKKSLKGNTKVIGTINGIITFSGCVGGAFGAFLVGIIIQYGIFGVFLALMLSTLISALFLTRITVKDFYRLVKRVYSNLCDRHVYVVQV